MDSSSNTSSTGHTPRRDLPVRPTADLPPRSASRQSLRPFSPVRPAMRPAETVAQCFKLCRPRPPPRTQQAAGNPSGDVVAEAAQAGKHSRLDSAGKHTQPQPGYAGRQQRTDRRRRSRQAGSNGDRYIHSHSHSQHTVARWRRGGGSGSNGASAEASSSGGARSHGLAAEIAKRVAEGAHGEGVTHVVVVVVVRLGLRTFSCARSGGRSLTTS